MKRRAVGHVLATIMGITLLFGIGWLIFYWGLLLPMENISSQMFGTSMFDSNTYTFGIVLQTWWPFFILIIEFVWGWVQSTKRDLQSI